MKIIRWGILGTGAIAKKFASDLFLVEGAELVAVGSRTKASAEKFAKIFQVKYYHESYESLARSQEVDVIYIATPHSLHYENTILCLQNGKGVLCEKPFAMNIGQAKGMISLAKEKNLFLMDALWTKFLPHCIKMQEMINVGMIGDVRSILVNFGFKPMSPINPRLFDPKLGGGSLMDIGIYNVFLVLSILGKPDEIVANMTPTPNGVDEQCAINFYYKNGAMAQLFSSLSANLPTEADICGTEGRIRLTSNFYELSSTVEFYKDQHQMQTIQMIRESGFGYQYEARHVNECLKKGLKESPIVNFADTLLLIDTIDRIRKVAGIHYRLMEQQIKFKNPEK
ncbi:MAG: Gfo/Idh/MocA family oxidoreductase [Puia sp.]